MFTTLFSEKVSQNSLTTVISEQFLHLSMWNLSKYSTLLDECFDALTADPQLTRLFVTVHSSLALVPVSAAASFTHNPLRWALKQ